jgi:hypothetical protein
VGTFNIPEAKKGQASARSNIKEMMTFFFTPVGWCITSTHHKAKTLTKNTTWKSFVTFMILCSARDQTCGQQERGSCFMTKHQQLIQTFLSEHNIPVVQLAPYSPDVAHYDFWLFPHLKTQLKGTRFESRDVTQNTTAKLYSIHKKEF